MRLQLIPTACAVLLWSSLAESGDVVAKVSTEVSAYQDTDAISVLTPTVAGSVENPTQGWSARGRYLVDIVSAASVDIVSTASRRWSEVRHVGSLEAAYKPHDFGVSASGSISREPDYLAMSAGGTIEQDFLQKNLTVQLGYGHGRDTVGRSDTPFDVFSRIVSRNNVNLAFTFIVDRRTVMTIAFDAMFERGDSSKPYRYIPLFSPDIAPTITRGASIDSVNRLRSPERVLEQLPVARDRAAITYRLAQRRGDTTLRFSERLYLDSWGMRASTSDLRAITDVSDRVELWPHVRLHLQSAVSFWERAYVIDGASFPALRTGDRELGALGTLTFGGGTKIGLGGPGHRYGWAITGSFDAMWTDFANALYLSKRLGAFAAIGLEAEL